MKVHEEKLRTQKGDVFGWIMDDVIPRSVCQQLIMLGRPSLKPSTTLEPIREEYRTSSNTFLHYNEGMKPVDDVAKIVTDIIEVPLENCEGMQLVHYKPGQYYKPHHDYFQPNSSYWDKEIKRGGQRTWTAFLYLNDVKEGGTTNFPYINMEVKPQAGRMVLWMNTFNGNTIEDSYHEARAPKGCEKWGANIWVREKKFN